jgi:hypothetical protein
VAKNYERRKLMKKIYFAGKFNKKHDKSLTLSEQLKNDYRSKLLKSSKLLTYPTRNLKLSQDIIYQGPFYCEEASSGDFTSLDCNTILKEEYKAVLSSDTLVVVFDNSFSTGTVVELSWGLEHNKEIIIFYKEENGVYQIKSEYWFAILNAKLKNPKTQIIPYLHKKELIPLIKKHLKLN